MTGDSLPATTSSSAALPMFLTSWIRLAALVLRLGLRGNHLVLTFLDAGLWLGCRRYPRLLTGQIPRPRVEPAQQPSRGQVQLNRGNRYASIDDRVEVGALLSYA